MGRTRNGEEVPVLNMNAPDAVERVLAEKCRSFEALFRAERIPQMVRDFYAVDAVLEGADLPPQHGRDAIERVFTDARASYSAIRINLDPVIVTGDMAYGGITNINIVRDGSEEVHRGVMIWRRIEGGWYVQHDFFFTQREDIVVESLFA